jgi:diaminopimelate decarboxylase
LHGNCRAVGNYRARTRQELIRGCHASVDLFLLQHVPVFLVFFDFFWGFLEFQKKASAENMSVFDAAKQAFPDEGADAITDVSPVLKHCIAKHPHVFDATGATEPPVALFYDLDIFDAHLNECNKVFGPTFHHCAAIKSCPLSKIISYMQDTHNFGIECASIGEVMQAQTCGVRNENIVFDSPSKTRAELEFAIEQKIHCNMDNFDEYQRAVEYIAKNEGMETGNMGFRINPLVGSGTIAALSVSTSDGKFAVPITDKPKLLKVYKDSPWMNSAHVHVGSGGMGTKVLCAGIRVLVDFAIAVNEQAGKQQITCLDIGGGMPANYWSDGWENQEKNVPTYKEYSDALRKEVPELFSGDYKVVTEFGQSVFAKTGFFASRVEWIKGTEALPVAIIHFGADACVRQIYTNQHNRRVEAYDETGSKFADPTTRETSVGGPLCFQGDFVAKNVQLPASLKAKDFVIMKDAGSNTMSMYSRHCSRLCPPVYGYRWTGGEVTSLVEIKARETIEQLNTFWGKSKENGGADLQANM